jgi:CRP-like cAMP-binding protein
LSITHDMLARMLGTRRVSITLAAGELQAEGVITLSRGAIDINDIQTLARIAGLQY